jgi:hypothetical protein
MYIPLSRRKKYQEEVKQSIRDNIPITGDLLKNPHYLQELINQAETEESEKIGGKVRRGSLFPR